MIYLVFECGISCDLECFIFKRSNVKFRHKQRLEIMVRNVNLFDTIRGLVKIDNNINLILLNKVASEILIQSNLVIADMMSVNVHNSRSP